VLLILHFRNINKRRLSSTFNIKKNWEKKKNKQKSKLLCFIIFLFLASIYSVFKNFKLK
jgi:hypothetical protein